jgi:hypothetical protein
MAAVPAPSARASQRQTTAAEVFAPEQRKRAEEDEQSPETLPVHGRRVEEVLREVRFVCCNRSLLSVFCSATSFT